MFAFENFLETTHGLRNRNVLAFRTGKDFRDVERLAEKTLNLARAINRQLVLRTQFIHAENGDDVLKIFVALQNFLHAARNSVMLFADNFRRERF